ncbi:hypothetical protein BSKO_06961 [Bryopsis sp. KO-2023]|nr:hypothetical protein BSKO_06961 [Bryopsis sp. KO-2023]
MRFPRKVVSYFYDEEIGNYSYGEANPMRPHRLRLTHNLVTHYGLARQLVIHRPSPRDARQLTEFHADDYVNFLQNITPDNKSEYIAQLRRFNVGVAGEADCPVFDGLFQYCQVYAGGSVDGAAMLANGSSEICVNWSGGMHHAKKAEASGFCYINDIVLAILELLKTFQRVLYVDIDIHHGDGVEEAFYRTDRVMTVSFHKHGEFFPGTGALGDIGYNRGKYYSLNVPLREGMDDASYKTIFEPIMEKVLEVYQPEAIVVCAGADSLSGDRIGCFNLSLEGHSNCIEFLSKYSVPMLVLGGGGYTLRNVSRCWTYETGKLMGSEMSDKIPERALREYNYYMDTGRLRIETSNMRNANTAEHLEMIKMRCLENLSRVPPAPGAPLQERPAHHELSSDPEEDPDVRGGGQAASERRREQDDESDSEDDYRIRPSMNSSPPPKRMRVVENGPMLGHMDDHGGDPQEEEMEGMGQADDMKIDEEAGQMMVDMFRGDDNMGGMSSASEVDPETM